MEERAIRVGVVGAGYWGTNLVRVSHELGILDSVCDEDPTALASTRHSYPDVKITSNFESLLERPIDAVIIATPAQTHARLAVRALKAGKHIFVEKPLALTVAEGEEVAAAAEHAGKEVVVGHLLLYHPAVQKILVLISSDAIGRIWHMRSRRLALGKIRLHENVWWSFAPHDIALMLRLMQGPPLRASASQASRANGLSDIAYADYTFSGGRSAHIEVCWLDPEKSARLDLFGERGVLTFCDSRAGGSLILKPLSIQSDGLGPPSISRGEERMVPFSGEEPLRAELRAFVDCVQKGKPVESSARHGIAVLRALEMADDSERLTREMKAPA
jgi:UDP-2-acetamido-3-amino-2,3-dideoxy-glucuronate N-acetyltransferase